MIGPPFLPTGVAGAVGSSGATAGTGTGTGSAGGGGPGGGGGSSGGSGGGSGGGGAGGGGDTSGGSGVPAIPVASPGATVSVGGSQAIVWLDDNMKNGQAMNGEPAIASIMKRIANLADQIAYAGKPYFSWIADFAGSTSGHEDASSDPVFRQIYLGRNYGSVAEGTYIHWMAPDDPGNQMPNASQAWGVRFYDTSYSNSLNYSTGTAAVTYPLGLQTDRIVSSRGFTAANSELKISSSPESPTSIGPRLHSGLVLQQPQDLIDPVATGSYVDSSGTQVGKNPYVGTQLLHVGGDVVGVTGTESSSEALRRLRVNLVDTIQFRRGQIGWSAIRPGTNYVNFGTSSQNWRYIFDQAFGDSGAGFANLSVPGITLPLYLSAQDMSVQVRVYVFVYAAMSGTTNTGSIAISNRDSSGTRTNPAAVTNPITISGTTFQWYPSVASATGASLNLATAPYFLGYAGGYYDRVALLAKSSGATDTVRIAAWTMIPIGLAYQPTTVTTVTTPTPPGTPYLWYSAQDINLTSNSGIADGASLASWKNKGSAGSAGDMAQATGANKPTFKLVGSAGKISNKSSIAFSGSQWFSAAGVLAINQTDIVALVARTNNASVVILCVGDSAAQRLSINTGPVWNMYAGGSRDTGVAVTINDYHALLATWAGASSAFRADKVNGSLAGSPGTANAVGFSLGADAGGSNAMTGEIVEVLVYTDGSATAATIEAYFDAMYGSSWPQ